MDGIFTWESARLTLWHVSDSSRMRKDYFWSTFPKSVSVLGCGAAALSFWSSYSASRD